MTTFVPEKHANERRSCTIGHPSSVSVQTVSSDSQFGYVGNNCSFSGN